VCKPVSKWLWQRPVASAICAAAAPGAYHAEVPGNGFTSWWFVGFNFGSRVFGNWNSVTGIDGMAVQRGNTVL
jgi:hypothetical protein